MPEERIHMWPFSDRKGATLRTFIITEEPPPPDVPAPDTWDVDLAIAAREIAALYQAKGWQIAGTEGEYPSGAEVLEILLRMAHQLNEEQKDYTNTARLMAIHDADFPGSVDLYLHIGHASPAVTDHHTGDGISV